MELTVNTCRLCLCSDTSLESLYEKLSEEEIHDMLCGAMNLDIQDSEQFVNICADCIVKVQLMYNVWCEFREADRVFKVLLNEYKEKQLEFGEHDDKTSTITIEILGVVDDQERIIKTEILDDDEQVLEPSEAELQYQDQEQFEMPQKIEVEPEMDEFVIEGETFEEMPMEPTEGIDEPEDEGNVDDSSSIKCYICLEVFEKQDSLDKHLLLHTDLLTYYCEKCLLYFDEINELNQHFSNHQFPFGCLYCEKKYTTAYGLTAHNLSCRGFKCPVCDCRFEFASMLSQHKKMHNIKNELGFVCDACGQNFTMKCNLVRHIRQKLCFRGKKGLKCVKRPEISNVDVKSVKIENIIMKSFRCCDICGRECESNSRLAFHLERDHAEFSFQLYGCDKCDKKFTTLEKSKRHRFLHKNKVQKKEKLKDPNICHICTKEFKYDRELLEHLRNDHQQTIQVYQCNKCLRNFSTDEKLKKHIYNSHTEKKTSYVCTHCGKKFSKKLTLKDHENTHLGVTEYKCDLCYKTFAYKHSLDRHNKFVHNDAKDFICDYCDKSFKRKTTLTIHRRIHTGEKPYECALCHGKFIDSSTLIKHRQKMHR